MLCCVEGKSLDLSKVFLALVEMTDGQTMEVWVEDWVRRLSCFESFLRSSSRTSYRGMIIKEDFTRASCFPEMDKCALHYAISALRQPVKFSFLTFNYSLLA